MRRLFASVLAVMLPTTMLAGCAIEPARPPGIAPNDYAAATAYAARLIRFEMDKHTIAGLSIALVDDQRIIWAEGFGYADLEKKAPATADTLYRAASISKLFTATAAMQLAEHGKLDIDRPLRESLPGFAIRVRNGSPDNITPRELMTHHSGLPRERLKGILNPHPAPFASVVSDIQDDYAAYPPNLIYYYSDLGVSLLGAAIEHQAGMPFAAYMKQHILEPLGMSHSSFDTGLATSPLMARGYRGLTPEAEPSLRDVPAGGLNTSVNDLARFMSMVFASGMSDAHRILKPESVTEMLRPQNTAVPLDLNFRMGLGWMLSPFGEPVLERAGAVAHHSGETLLFRSHLFILPQHKLGVVVLSNSSTATAAVDHIAAETLALALEAKTGIRPPERARITADDTPVPAETVREFSGAYTTLAGFSEISACGHGLCVSVGGRDFDLVHGSDGLFRLDYSLLGFIHINLGPLAEIGLSRRSIAGREVLIAHSGREEIVVGERIGPPAHLGAWRPRVGSYEITNQDDDTRLVNSIRIIERHGFLLLELTEPELSSAKSREPLMPLSDDEAILPGPVNGGGGTVRAVTVRGKQLLEFSGYLLRKIDP